MKVVHERCAGLYGTYEAASSGMYASAAVTAALTAFSAYGLLRQMYGGSTAQGANGAGSVPKDEAGARNRYFFRTAVTDPAAQPSQGEMVLDLVAAPEFYARSVAADARYGTTEFQRAVSEFFGDGGVFSISLHEQLPRNAYGYWVGRLGPEWPPKIAIGPPSFTTFDEFADTIIHEFAHHIGYNDPGVVLNPRLGLAADFATREMGVILRNRPWP